MVINTGNNAVTFTGVLSGTGGMTVVGGGGLTLTASNAYTGGTSIGSGSSITLTNAYALANSIVTVNGSNGLLLNTNSGTVTPFYVAGLSGGGSINLADSTSNPGTNYPVTLNVGANGTSSTFNGALTGSGGLLKTGSGILDLGGENSYSGPTTIVASRLKIDYTQSGAPLTNIINYAGINSPLYLSAGTLTVQTGGQHPNSQTFNNTYIQAGSSEIAVAGPNPANVVLNLESLFRSTGSTVDFTLPLGTQTTTNCIVTSTGNANGIIGAYATVSGTNWAASGGPSGFITAYNAYTTGNLGGMTTNLTANVEPTGTQTAVTSALSFYTLNLTGTVGVTMTGAGALTLTDGGLLCSSAGSNGGPASIVGGTLEGFNDGELIIDTATNLNISSVIANNGATSALTKSGTATLILTGNNTYNGMTTVGNGTLQIGNGGGNGSLGLSNTVTAYGTLVFDLSSASTYSGLITGAGNLTQIGSGVTTLTGSSNYTGPTTISAGTLLIGSGGTGASIGTTLGVLDNGSLGFNHTDAVTFSPLISGSGSLSQAGTGLLTLLASNTYTGGTTVSGGTLQIGNGNSGEYLASPSVSLANSAALVFNHADALTYSGVIGGTGNLTQTGGGLLTLLGTNNYLGSTTISTGTLQVGNGIAPASLGTGPMTDNSLVVFDIPGAPTYSGVISGSGSLTQAGTGILTLTGSNKFIGATTISAGSLQIGNGGSGASIGSTIGVLDNSALIFNHADAVTFSATTAISGSGSLTQAGTGLLTLLGNNTYSGPTTIASGTLQIGNGGSGASIASTSAVLDNGSLIFNHGDTLTLAFAAVSGSGSLTQAGSGVLVLPGSNTYTGGTLVSGGTLQVGNGNGGEFLASPAVVLSSTGAALVFSNTDSVSYSGVISGSGSLMEIGAGALTLLGSNYSYTGSTIVSGGVLQVGNGTIGAALAGTTNVQLTANGANYGGLVFDLPGNATYGGAIGGVGNVTQAGSGLLTLTGSNLSSGQTTVSAGSLQLGVGGATGTITGSLYVGNGTFLLDRSGTMSNGIAGSGPLVKIGSDSVTLNGNLSGFRGRSTSRRANSCWPRRPRHRRPLHRSTPPAAAARCNSSARATTSAARMPR